MHTLLAALQKLPEPQLSREVITPLLSAIYDAPVEYTHGQGEQGRDLVCVTTDELGESAVVCCQVKAHKLSSGPLGPRSLYSIGQQALAAKLQGVTLENGAQLPVSKVLIITPYSFSDSQRRNVSELLKKLHLASCTLITGERLAFILAKHCPGIATQVAQYSNPRVAALLAQMSSHAEARAFGLPYDRPAAEFTIPLRIWPSAKAALAVVLGATTTHTVRYFPAVSLSADRATPVLTRGTSRRARAVIAKRLVLEHLESVDPLVSKWQVAVENIEFSAETLPNRADHTGGVTIHPIVTLSSSETLQELSTNAKVAWRDCPSEVGRRPVRILRAYGALHRLEAFLKDAREYLGSPLVLDWGFDLDSALAHQRSAYTVRLTQRRNLLRLGSPILVDGPPGCGKTSLLRLLSIELIEREEAVIFVPCARIKRRHKHAALTSLAESIGLGSEARPSKSINTVLLLDGLDEAQIDLGARIMREYGQFKSVVATCRSAFPTELRSSAPMVLGLAPYSSEERNEFLRRWFADSPRLARVAQSVVRRYKDIDRHTRVPMLATLLAALVQAGHEPRSRCEMYDGRLALLLERWDVARGVERRRVSDGELKKRFLMYVAYGVHQIGQRFFGRVDLRRVFELMDSSVDVASVFDDLIRDLVLAHGVIVEIEPDLFSFGHLTFQEHLAGLYMARYLTPKEVLLLCEDPRWLEPLKFYAAAKGEVTELVHEAVVAEKLNGVVARCLEQMLPEAPYTSAKTRQIVSLAARVLGPR